MTLFAHRHARGRRIPPPELFPAYNPPQQTLFQLPGVKASDGISARMNNAVKAMLATMKPTLM